MQLSEAPCLDLRFDLRHYFLPRGHGAREKVVEAGEERDVSLLSAYRIHIIDKTRVQLLGVAGIRKIRSVLRGSPETDFGSRYDKREAQS